MTSTRSTGLVSLFMGAVFAIIVVVLVRIGRVGTQGAPRIKPTDAAETYRLRMQQTNRILKNDELGIIQ